MSGDIETRTMMIDCTDPRLHKLALHAYQQADRDPVETIAHLIGALVLSSRLSGVGLDQVIEMMRVLNPVMARFMRDTPEMFGQNTGRH